MLELDPNDPDYVLVKRPRLKTFSTFATETSPEFEKSYFEEIINLRRSSSTSIGFGSSFSSFSQFDSEETLNFHSLDENDSKFRTLTA